MKTIASFVLLVTGVISSLLVFGQTHHLDSTLHFSPPDLRLQPGQLLVVPGPDKSALVFDPFPEQKPKTGVEELFSVDRIIALEPDHMPCVVSRLSGIERMPIKKLNDVLVEPMPNLIQRGPSIKTIPGRPHKKPFND